MTVRNVFETFEGIGDYWSPVAVAEANGQLVEVAKVRGEFVWHHYADEDEVFLILKGMLTLRPGDIHTVPRGVEHCPVCDDDVICLLFEPGETAHTGNVVTNMTKSVEAQRAGLTA